MASRARVEKTRLAGLSTCWSVRRFASTLGEEFASLYVLHHQELYRYCRTILRDDHDAQDAAQTTMVKALSALPTIEREVDHRPWLFRIAHNESVSLLRARRPTEPLHLAAPVGVDDLPQRLEDRERLTDLRADLGDLPERQRTALVLREFSGYSHEQIAERLDTTPRAVKQLIFEARSALHVCTEERGLACTEVQH